MKDYRFPVIIFILAILFNSCKENSNPIVINTDEGTDGLAKWTFLFYDDADFSSAFDPFEEIAEYVSSNENINYLVLRDRYDSEAGYYFIDSSNQYIFRDSLGEVNMGDKVTLSDFIKYGKENYPAERTILALYDHGNGWMGACWDKTSGDDNLSMAEISDALTENNNVDIIMFSAPCLMGSIESAYQLRNSADFYIGSQDMSGFIFWRYMMADMDSLLKAEPNISSEDLSERIIGLHEKNSPGRQHGDVITMSAINLSKMEDVLNTFSDVTEFYISNPDNFWNLSFLRVANLIDNYPDYKHLLERMYEYEESEDAKLLINHAINSFDQCIAAEYHGGGVENKNGLNIYFKNSYVSSGLYILPYARDLEFVTACKWNQLVVNAFGGLSPAKIVQPELTGQYSLRLNR